MRTLSAVPAAVLVATTCVPASPVAPSKPAQPPQTLAAEIACDLADRVGPRLAGSPGDAAAVQWALEKMKELGLENVRAEPFKAPHWERGPASAAILAPALVPQPLSIAALGGSPSTPPDGITAQVVRVTSIDALKALSDDAVRGRIVFYDKRMERVRDGFASYGSTVDIRSQGAIEASKKGAVASLIRSVGTSNRRFPHTGAQRPFPDGVAPIPAAALAIPDAETLARLVARGPVTVRLTMQNTMHGEADSANVIGEVPGRELPGEVVLIGAHLDAWDLGRGAVDDGAGVGVVLEVARLLKTNPPRRTVRVVLFGNEENGLRGAIAYAKTHEAELASHQAALEIDGGAGRAWFMNWRGDASSEPFFARMAEPLKRWGIEGVKREEDAGGADLIPLTASGMTKIELQQDARPYFDVHHTADDTCDKIVPEDLGQVTAVTAWLTRELADAPSRLAHLPPPRQQQP